MTDLSWKNRRVVKPSQSITPCRGYASYRWMNVPAGRLCSKAEYEYRKPIGAFVKVVKV